MLETDYERAWRAAHEAEQEYLAAVRLTAAPADLAARSVYARDRWTAVSTICALGVDGARARMDVLPLRHRCEALNAAWRDTRNWTALGEDAAARGDLFGALACAHVPAPPTREVIRLYAADVSDDVYPLVSSVSRHDESRQAT